VFPHLPSSLHLERVTREQTGAAAAVALALTGVLLYVWLRKRESPEEIELQRRTVLAREGRIIDGSIVGIDGSTEDNSADGALDVSPDDLVTPRVLIYRYRIAGVTYECAQDVTTLAEHVHNLRIDLPVQVRYDPRNPGNSILVAENWNGVRLDGPELHSLADTHSDV
jgi:hypothetical protein